MANHGIVDYIVFEVMGSVGILLNSAQFAVMIRRKNTKSQFDISILGLCVADLITAVIWFLLYVGRHLLINKVTAVNEKYLDIFSDAGLNLSFASSLLHTLFIAAQRSVAVFSPFKCRVYFTRRRCSYCLFLIWMMSILVSFLVTYFQKFHIMSIMIIVCACLLAVCYTILCCAIKRQSTIFTSVPAQNGRENDHKVMAYCVFITIVFVLCTVPFGLYIGDFIIIKNSYLRSALKWLMLFNMIFDSLLYFIFRRNESMTCHSALCGCCCSPRPERSDGNFNRGSGATSCDVQLTEIPGSPYPRTKGCVNASHVQGGPMKGNATLEPGRRFCNENGVELMEIPGSPYPRKNGCVNAAHVQGP